ncbi:NAD-dependent protein deacetylase sirtuin-3, mitochondrial isoform X3 [Ornithorhynchus anatinus]|uniref:NAD-dependent protein deacetylase sirtuin-3, mitochondrial isoform X3 n=1 Tax=Ornithorhynchus anatinus TaxID=9258 RepID=UPI0019D4A68B|nr:NAD-dependent protein deacetylase sirtuin-3, mitochondrial isoform X3 [Ornithorhynchus anatinus]
MGLGCQAGLSAARKVLLPSPGLRGSGGWRALCVHSQRGHGRRLPIRGPPGSGHAGGLTGGTEQAAGTRGLRPCGPRFFSLTPGVADSLRTGGESGGREGLSLRDIAERIRRRECHRLVVMAGAGISTPSGIPDFRPRAPSIPPCRSPGSGLYSNLQQYAIPYPEAIFELAFFHRDPKPFFTLAKELYPGNYRPNFAHYFLRLLHDKGLLLRLYTQNIDGLERAAGIPPSKLVEAHGTFASATCTVCLREYPGEDFRVEPFASLAGAARSSTPRVLINRDAVGPFARGPRANDVAQLGDVVSGVEKLVDLLGWTEEIRDLIRRETEKLAAQGR